MVLTVYGVSDLQAMKVRRGHGQSLTRNWHCVLQRRACIDQAMQTDVYQIVHAAIARMPEWIRNELISRDPSARERAEEALAAMVASAIERHSLRPAD